MLDSGQCTVPAPEAARSHGVVLEQPQALEVPHGRGPVMFQAIGHLPGGFGQVDDPAGMVAVRQGLTFFQEVRRAGINGMGLHGYPHPGMALVETDEVLGELEPVLRRAIIGGRKVIQHLPHHRPDTSIRGGLGHRVGKQIHVTKRCGAGEQHLRHRQPGAPVHELVIQVALRGENVVIEPIFQGEVVGQPPE